MTDDSRSPRVDRASRKLVIVTGSGRSGTSTIAGALKKLGLYVPQPENPPDSKNPRGYFEPRWATRFDKHILKDAGVHNNDSRPEAIELTEQHARNPSLRAEVERWLASQPQTERQILIKDPHILWLSELWVDSASKIGLDSGFVTMLRHPAEVVGSRDLAYLSKRPEEFRRVRETANVAGWINIMLTNERVSRSFARTFVRYGDLIADWRTAVSPVSKQLGLSLNSDLRPETLHAVDDFIDSDLRRSRTAWDDLSAPQEMKDLAESVWRSLDKLVVDPYDGTSMSELNRLREEYDEAHAQAVAVAHYNTEALISSARQQVREELQEQHKKELVRVRRRLRRRLEQDMSEGEAAPRRWAERARSRILNSGKRPSERWKG